MNSMALPDSDEEEEAFSPQTLRIANDPTLYTKWNRAVAGGNLLLAVCVFMDDVIYMGASPSVTTEFKERMINLFEMTDLGLMHHFLGLEIKQGEGGVFVSQAKYAANLLHRFNVTNCEAAITTPMNVDEKLLIEDDGSGKADARKFRGLVRGLACLTRTRPDIALAVARVSEFVRKPTNQHFGAAKRILGYIAGTRDLGIWYSNGAEFKLSGFTSSDWDGDRGSRSGFVFSFGSGAVTWSSRKQGVATLSTSEAEYLAAATSASEAMWLRRQLGDLDEEQEDATEILCGNGITKKPLLHGRTEHIDVELDLIRELVSGGFVSLKFCNDSQQLADIVTKSLPREKHVDFTARLGLCTYRSRVR
ncbi:hypothetical protein SASPL_133870 [Salvia splendens]|uniref:Reverse transcriptase Ty1/copia-type domain-containing protein n=1 Tax=Salvia splendens TaxID=180675 RepID=A0A8X8X3U6_SALSN|nr:hypothetical protein SASPL_133870 [Salvia splendens]